MRKIRVLIVDDSATMRSILRARLAQDPEIEICGEAEDPLVARDAIKALNPDVLTLDVEMPRMSGLDFLEKIMRLRPMPVIMVSTLTQQGAEETIEALEMGAFDCIGKPNLQTSADAFEGLAATIKAAARSRVRTRADRAAPAAPVSNYVGNGKIVAIGSSTGGVEALVSILTNFPANCPPTIITQHMPPTFTTSFAARLNKLCAPQVAEATEGAVLAPGKIYLAPGGDRHLEVVGVNSFRCRLRSTDAVNGHRPSVDVLFNSVAALGSNSVGVILTGMGRDGATGLLAMRAAGARTIGQDESSCVVYGMPKSAFEIGAVERQLHLHRIAPAILDLCATDAREVA